jgi:hypothetical protein
MKYSFREFKVRAAFRNGHASRQIRLRLARPFWAIATVTGLPGAQNRHTAEPRKRAQKDERFTGLVCVFWDLGGIVFATRRVMIGNAKI